MGRPKTGETSLTIRTTQENLQLLSALATANGVTLDAYVTGGVIAAHIENQKNHPALAGYYKANYPIFHTEAQADTAAKPQKAKK